MLVNRNYTYSYCCRCFRRLSISLFNIILIMSEKDNILAVKVTKKNGGLVYQNKSMESLHQEFIDNLAEGQTVEIFFEAYQDNGTNLQLAKIHASIRKLGNELGHTFEEMKLIIKRASGLAYDVTDNELYIKSFGDCSVEELGSAIQAIIEIGDAVNVNFRGKLPQQNPL